MISVTFIFFITAAVIFIGFFGEILFRASGLSEILFLIAIGIILGPIFGVFPTKAIVSILPYISQLTLAMIMFELGMELRVMKVIQQYASAVLRTVIYVFMSVTLIALALRLIGWPLYSGLFMATIIGGETTTTVVPYIAKSYRDDRLFTNVTLESTLNSVILIVLFTMVLNAYVAGQTISVYNLTPYLSSFFSQISVGVVIGFIAALLWLEITKRFGTHNYFYIATIGYVLAVYAFVDLINGSSILAVLTLGIVYSNYEWFTALFWKGIVDFEDQLNYIKSFQGELSFFLRTYFYVLLGLVFTVSYLLSADLYVALAIILGILVGSRYVATKASTKGFKVFERPIFILMAQGLTPAVLSSLALYYNIPNATLIVTITTLVILVTNAITIVGWFFVSKGLKKTAVEQTKSP